MDTEMVESVDLTKDSDNSEDAKDCKLETNFFTIVAPSSFRPNSDYVLTLTLHKSDVALTEPCRVKVSVKDEQDENRYKVEKEIELKENITQFLTIPIGNIALDRNYKLEADSVSGIKFHKEASINIQTKNNSIMIQTDRAIYKPGDLIRFRVLVLDFKLRPAQIQSNALNIMITDPQGNHVKQCKGVTTLHGVFQNEYQLSDLANPGNWTILAEIGEEKKTKELEIREYVLPKFEINIESPQHFTLRNGKVVAIINAKYTYGKKMRGKATVSVSDKDSFGYFYRRSEDDGEPKSPLTQKTIDIDGRVPVEFDIKNELKYDLEDEQSRYSETKNYEIFVKVVEDLTGLSYTSKKVITVHKSPYKISSSLSQFAYKRASPLNFTVSVRNHDNSPPVLSSETSRKVKVLREQFVITEGEEKCEMSENMYDLGSNGDLNLTWKTLKTETHFSIVVVYDGQRQELGTFYTERKYTEGKEGDFLKATVLTQNPSVNNDVEVEVTTSEPLKNYTYQLVTGGKIMKSETIDLPENTSTSHRFTFMATQELIPNAQLVVYFVKKDNLMSTKCDVNVKKELKNLIDLNLNPETANPGQIINIAIKTKPKSFIGLLGVDQSVLLLKTGNDLSSSEAFSELESFSKQTKRRTYMPGQDFHKVPNYDDLWDDFKACDTLLFTNIVPLIKERLLYKCIAKRSVMKGGGGLLFGAAAPAAAYAAMPFGAATMNAVPLVQSLPPKIRKDFPDTWLWESIVDEKSTDGITNFKKRVPDTITSWVVTGFSIDSDTGLGLTKEPKKLTVFQPFFVSLNLPYSVKRGEVVTVPCTVFNYIDDDIEAEVTLENENDEFEFVDEHKSDGKAAYEPLRTKLVFVKSSDGTTTNFIIKPTHVGLISLKVKAVSVMAGDAVTRILNVQSEGVPQFFNKAVFVDLREKNELEPISLKIDIPDTALPDSTKIEVSCVGDLLGGTIKNLQKLIRLPYGCGEQNMLNFVPNIVVLNYLIHTNQLTAEIESMAKKYMEIGYQRELKYKHQNGSFSAFGRSDNSGSTWLTAFVARSFQRASEHIFIDGKIVTMALDYLRSVQNLDGSFAEKGSICHKEMQGGSSKGVALTAYVLTAFLQSKETIKAYETTIELAVKNLISSLKDMNDVYALSVAAYALQLAQHGSKDEVLLNLLNTAQSKDNYKWWDKSIQMGCCSKTSKTLNVETTAYGLLALLAAQQESQCLPILRWLLGQRNNQGGFEGTQDTVVGIEALAAFAAKFSNKSSDVKVTTKSIEDNAEKSFVVNQENSLILQTERLSANTRIVDVNASGHGFALVEVAYRYNVNEPDPVPAFQLNIEAASKTSENVDIHVSTCYQPPNDDGKEKRSNMVVLEISFPSGFVVNNEALNDLKSKVFLIKKVETKDGDTVAVIYFDHLGHDLVTFNLDGYRQFVVTDQKPSSVVIYDYYDSALSARAFYTPEEVEQEPDDEPMEISTKQKNARSASPLTPKHVKPSKIPIKS